ncbi:MAG: sigma54 specific transcriptional regulator, Fis family [Deltaproteobacteria bacterium]|nr:sigma54 specific transcriptional regulator, Fis family [Deltaproteobacteria bacterium]
MVVDHVEDAQRGSEVFDIPDEGEVTIGRAASSTIVVDDDQVSRHHARIRRRGDIIEIEDINSRNGTWVNGERLDAKRRLISGDEVSIGPIVAVLGVTGTLRRAPGVGVSSEQLVAVDPEMKRVYTLVERIANTPMTVLINGETGVGKELVAEAIHRGSGRREKPFIKLNCAALPENLLESELFGYERGAFTGAERRKVGYFEAADGGTLFLDEIGEMPSALQAKLLRVLERKVIIRVGATSELAVDVRLVAATHRDLDVEASEGRFRSDLLFRISGFTIAVPPLRERQTEILPLAEHFARVSAIEQGRSPAALSPDAREVLQRYRWPGNVRELKNAIERALVLCGNTITAADLPDRLRDTNAQVPASFSTSDVREQVAEVEKATIQAALEAEDHNQTRAARRIGLSRRTLIYKMEKYGLKPPPK